MVVNYRLGYNRQYSRVCLIKVLGADESLPNRLIGWRVGWPADDPRIFGRIVRSHGKKGVLRVKFSRGLPGQALSTRVKIMK